MNLNSREEEEARLGGKKSKKDRDYDKNAGKGRNCDITYSHSFDCSDLNNWYIFNFTEFMTYES